MSRLSIWGSREKSRESEGLYCSLARPLARLVSLVAHGELASRLSVRLRLTGTHQTISFTRTWHFCSSPFPFSFIQTGDAQETREGMG